MRVERKLGWFWYYSGEEKMLDPMKCGKWMYFFTDQEFAQKICAQAIDEGVCYECKCSDLELIGQPNGVVCFYLNGDDIANHRRVINFMMKLGLIKKTKAGKYYNNSFKFDSQTRAGEYGADFEGKIKLEKFVDLNTGEWIYE